MDLHGTSTSLHPHHRGFWDELPPSTAPKKAFERDPVEVRRIPIHRDEHPPPEPQFQPAQPVSRPIRVPKVPQKQRKQQSPALAPVVQPEWRQTEVTSVSSSLCQLYVEVHSDIILTRHQKELG